MPSVSAAAGTQQQLRLEAEPVATTFSAADTTAFLQGSWKEAMERGAVRCIIAETAPNHEEEHKDWEAMIEAARQRNLDEEVPPPSSNANQPTTGIGCPMSCRISSCVGRAGLLSRGKSSSRV
jgi:hypothetical protein